MGRDADSQTLALEDAEDLVDVAHVSRLGGLLGSGNGSINILGDETGSGRCALGCCLGSVAAEYHGYNGTPIF